MMDKIISAYEYAVQRYADLGVNVDAAVKTLGEVPISMHCWQGDDVSGFEDQGTMDGSGLQVTGGYPGKARNADELRADMEMAFSLIPGKHRINLHAIYAETNGEQVDRDALEPRHFAKWIEWAKKNGIGLDFNGTFFAHPKALNGLSLSHPCDEVREFWVNHAIACRKIGSAMGMELNNPCVVNVWIPDGSKDLPADRLSPRLRLQDSLDKIFATELPGIIDVVECKLFGIGSESYVVGSHEFYMGYAIKNKKSLCLDSGHFHPTEGIADKISSVLIYIDEILLHVSRGVRWDSDHVVILSDELKALAEEIVRGGFLKRVHIGLDYFDASINRVAAWAIGMRNMQKALLIALLEPTKILKNYESNGDGGARLALMEECKSLPFSAVWDYFCQINNVPVGVSWINEVQKYERDVLLKR
jgi:L-rhamnose isomerase